MLNPTVSVIIPTRNCLAYLPAALESVFAQQYADIEILVIDDGSSDGTWAWLTQGQPPQVRPFQLQGEGVSAARNFALQMSGGALVTFLDADDVWRPEKLAPQVAFHLGHPEVLMSFTDYLHMDEHGSSHGGCFSFWPHFRRIAESAQGFTKLGHDGAARIFAENVVGTSTVMARRHAMMELGAFDKALPSAADWDMWIRLALDGPIACSPLMGTDYLMRPGSITGDTRLRIDCMERIYERYIDAIEAIDPHVGRSVAARIMVARAEHARSAGRPWTAVAAHAHAFLLNPSIRVAKATLADLRSAALGGQGQPALR